MRRSSSRRSFGSVDDRDEPVVPERFAQGTDDRRLVAAEPAFIVLVEIVLQDVVAEPLDQDLGATGAVGGLGRVARDVPDVDVLQPRILRYLVMLLERLDGCQRKVHHLVVGVPSQKMNRHVRAEVVVDPLGEPCCRVEAVTNLGDNQVCDFYVDVGSILCLEQGFKDGVSVGNPDVPPHESRLSTSFEVDGTQSTKSFMKPTVSGVSKPLETKMLKIPFSRANLPMSLAYS